MPLARMVKWSVYPAFAQLAAHLPLEVDDTRLIFLVGCGRSGTTAFGRALSHLSEVRYLNEPLHVWHAIDPRTDSLSFFGYPGRLSLAAADATPEAILRARRLFAVMQRLYPERLIVEKLPTNVLRIAWLHALFPRARFLAIVRHPLAVITSICRIAATNRYRILGRPTLNAWWGVDGHKRFQLIAEASGALPELTAERTSFTDVECAALEWLLSANALRDAMLNPALRGLVSVVRYEDLVNSPEAKLHEVSCALEVEFATHDIDRAARQINAIPDALCSELTKANRRQISDIMINQLQKATAIFQYEFK